MDFLNPSTFPIQPASWAIDDRHESETRHQKERLVKKPEKVEETEDSESEEQKHSLDLDA